MPRRSPSASATPWTSARPPSATRARLAAAGRRDHPRFHEAGARHVTLDLVGPYEERDRQIERFAAEVLPLLAALRKTPS